MNKYEAEIKNDNLIYQLEDKRQTFCGIGTNKTKRRLNKLVDSISIAFRLALEIEDKNITAKNCYIRKYKDKIYETKTALIYKLIDIFKENNWIYGIQIDNDCYSVKSVIFFELPDCEQISWHSDINQNHPIYKKEWDSKVNSTLDKLEVCIKNILLTNKLI